MPAIALVGPPRTGKSTVFELLGGNASRLPLRTDFTADRVVVAVPDPRFEELCRLFQPKKRTPVLVELLDIPGFSSQTDLKLRTIAFTEIRKAEGMAVVIDLFQDVVGEDPATALRRFWEEIVFIDYATASRGVENLEMAARSKRDPDAARRHEFLRGLLPGLEAGRGLRSLALDEHGEKLSRQYGFLTRLPVFVVANLEEAHLAQPENAPGFDSLHRFAEEHSWPLFGLSAKVEHEIAQLAPEDRDELLAAYHLEEPGLHRFLRAAYAGLELITFFTVGEDEVRGWTLRRGTKAKQGAGAIHSDLERGFIRGEVISWSQLLECGSLAEAKRRGLLRIEGKDYVVEDGEILHVRFSV